MICEYCGSETNKGFSRKYYMILCEVCRKKAKKQTDEILNQQLVYSAKRYIERLERIDRLLVFKYQCDYCKQPINNEIDVSFWYKRLCINCKRFIGLRDKVIPTGDEMMDKFIYEAVEKLIQGA